MLRAGLRVARDDGASLLVNKHNASHEILCQYLDETSVPGPLARYAVRSHAAHEQWGIDVADAVVFQSDADRERFDCPADTLIRTIPNGTDVDGDPSAAAMTDLRHAHDLDPETFICVFVGSYDYSPNRRAAETIDQEIAPQLPNVKFLLVGRDPPPVSAENVTPTGFVDDLAAALSLANAALCPIQQGSGTKLKMMDYLAAGLPVVTTPVGASGIDLTDGETALIRDSSEAFVDAIQRLTDSPELATRLGRNASDLGKQYTWTRLLADYDEVLTALLEDAE
jgi:glycosyltransferase involved in cell wall biosynthesis